MQTQDLTKLQDQIYQQYNKDGMLETILGFCLALGGFNFLDPHRSTAAFALLPIYMLVFGKVWRRRITFPRLGYNEMLAKRRAKMRKKVLTALACFIVYFALIIGAINWMESQGIADPFAHGWMKLWFGLPLCIFLVWMGRLRQNSTLYWTAGIMAILFTATALLHVSAGWAFLITGILLLIYGTVRLVLFLRTNPKLEGEPSGE